MDATGIIPACELAAMQTAAAATLDLACTLQRATTTKDAWGGQSVTLTPVAGVTQCGLAKPTAQISQQYAARLANQQAWVARFAVGTDVREDDTLLVNGQSLTVQALLTPISYSISLRALVATDR